MAIEVTQAQPTQDATTTRVINLRDVPEELYRVLKVFAAASNMGFRDYCVSALKTHVQQQRETGAMATLTLVMPQAPTNPPTQGGSPESTAAEAAK